MNSLLPKLPESPITDASITDASITDAPSADTSITDAPPAFPSPISMGLVKWTLGIVVAGSGLMAIAPSVRPATAVYLPPNTEAEYTYHSQQIQRYREIVNAADHTLAEHLHLADALAHAGEREAATQAYLDAMSHAEKSHSH